MTKICLVLIAAAALLDGCHKSNLKTKTITGSLEYSPPAVDGIGGYYHFQSASGMDSTILLDGYYEGHYNKKSEYEIYRGKQTQLVYTETGKQASAPCFRGDCSFSLVKAVAFTILP